MIDPAVAENIIQLAALASVVDGQASDQEKNLIVEMASYELRISPDQAREMLDRSIEQLQGIASFPGAILGFARMALQPLRYHDKHLAFYICLDVMYRDGQIALGEDSLIGELEKLAFGGW
ncbi:MAG: TerB family tellurite resistance protein [Okeania sp. SIO2F4]|uniref:tellurite resistance TerB family protein n=1 Tax=Okeania sp. SIO2F4 TaxID=2607790 RepID=UPI00142B8851|nr:hypothetical protein [Okeania sp. SIO2F4]NES03200.1 TerB family tellurite resistance protein [Okeania sp. SIO2F4]